ncbi:UBX domain-containing protein 2A isoform X2 [Strigops habroptila]|uniref:UBX domain-containing protein 2A isoform X2 n=1 Tax=Strigops habroptila TaxID=2489341 RepID=UPI0011D00D65|nr:UBX domain-containing protein 2A isoform X2 [Strigops habroptila]
MKDMDNIKTVKKEWCKSGTDDQILNGTEENCEYFVDNLFEEAQKVGAICVPPTTVKNQVDVIIKLWKNGFTVNDGELRSYTDVANQQFLDSIKKGELPFELRKLFDKEEVDVKVEDKKDKVYLSSQKPVFHPFSGHGYRLGSATPRIISKVRDDHQGPDNKRHLPLVPLNNLEPITNIQIWLADGERIIQKFNVSHSSMVLLHVPHTGGMFNSSSWLQKPQNKPCQRLHNKVSRIRGKCPLHTDYFAAISRAAR